MKNISLIIVLILSLSKAICQNADSIAIIQLLKSDYKPLQNFDIAAHTANCTSDYYLIEDAEVWSLQKEIEYFRLNASRRMTRKDQFTIRTLKLHGNVAYLIYELKSDITEGGKISTKYWTESAVFRKVAGKWKIALIHSTTIPGKF